MKFMHSIKRVISLFLAALLAFTPPLTYSAFDPVNDDTDIFLANPNIPSNRPNVLIIVDNTANWNTAFTNEKNALVSVVNGLNDQFNVGLMMMAETGGGNDNVDGGYVRFHVRQTTGANKQAFTTMVNNLHIINDRSNNAGHGQSLYEAYRYYAGLTSVASHGKVKTDKGGTTDPVLAPLAGPRALPDSNPASLYNSPATDACQKNFVILISNGPADNSVAEMATMESRIQQLTGSNAVIGLKPSGRQGNWSDEMARYMANADVNATLPAAQNIITYVVEVNPGTTGLGPDWTAVMKSTADNGKGKYFGVSSDASGVAIADALNQIFSEVQAVNSVFAASTLPVSVNVRGTNLNQVYIGVFRPDANKAPRWLGNLKLYNLALNSSTNTVFLSDARVPGPQPAQNAATGFISGNSISFWTQPSNFWGFRDASQNGVGGASDSPDGDLVEKGGAAQQLRIAFPNAETPGVGETLRNLYTCTTGLVGGAAQNCAPNSGFSLSNTPFSTTNEAIDAITLGLGSRQVGPLTAYKVNPNAITQLTDRMNVTLSNIGGGPSVNVTSLSNGATTRTITSLKTSTPKTVGALSALVAGTESAPLTNITRNNPTQICTATSSGTLPAQFATNATVTFSGVTGSELNGASPVAITRTSNTTFTFSCTNKAPGTGGTATVSAFPSTTATATLIGHGYASGQSITIAGATPTTFNGTFGITVTDANTFTYNITSASGSASGTITASGNTTTATAVTSANHGLPNAPATTSVNIVGANPDGYNGTKTVTRVDNTTFTYTVGSALSDNTGSPVYVAIGGSTLVTATTSVAHGFVAGQQVTLSGSNIPGYNGTFTIVDAPTATTFTFNTVGVQPANTSGTVIASGGGTSSTVTATAANHGFIVGSVIRIESTSTPADTVHPGAYSVLTVPDVNTFTYSTGGALAAPTGTYTVRSDTTHKAYVTLPAHGYATNDQIRISGASPITYNGTFSITKVNDNVFTYPLPSAPGPNTSAAAAAAAKSTTALATALDHNFADGSTVTITGASPAAFNGTYTVSVIDVNNFSYTIATPEGDASGAVVATQAATIGGNVANLVRWVRGEDNATDENKNLSLTDIRASIHGDVLHSRPAVVNYNRFGSDNDVYVFYGANDGIFRALKGGYATDAADPIQLAPGREAWGFIPPEFFESLNRLRNNTPIISSSLKKPYFADGPTGVYTLDTDNNGKLGDVGDKVNLYIAMRRGGRLLYALDVNNPNDPKYLWKISSATAGFGELGQTWSEPKVVPVDNTGFSLNGYTNPVIVFGAGYDPAVEDLDPNKVTAATTASVTTADGTVNRTMGRGIYVVDAITGALVWSAGKFAGATTSVSDMHFAIPADVSVVKNESGGSVNRAYAVDTGGNIWRMDFKPSAVGANDLNGTTVTKVAALGDLSTPAGRRKFQFGPDIVKQVGYDAILVGSGDREHPFDTSVVNRMYMVKDKGNDFAPLTGTSVAEPTVIESAMFDATSNCIQDATVCDSTQAAAAATALGAASGWYITLGAGEKVVGNAISLGGTTFFNTNQPDTGAALSGEICGANLGIARAYQVATADATATNDLNVSGTLTTSDRSQVVAGGGYLPSPVHVVVMLDGKPVEAVISGVQVSQPPGTAIASRLRKFWYKEVDR